uniref:Uncharacterized protein n=1 Tax=Anopheles atroparvus TaxID=41427 RepID=A0A182JDJ5_ANOAO
MAKLLNKASGDPSQAGSPEAPACIIISDVTIGLVTLPSPSGSPAPASFGQRRWRRRPREGTGRASTGPPAHLTTQVHQQLPTALDGKMKYLSAGHRESYTLVARKRYMKRMLYIVPTSEPEMGSTFGEC